MDFKKVVGQSQSREENKIKIINYIRIKGATSRTDIYKDTAISKPTVTRIIDQLLQEGLVIETGIGDGEAEVGRKPVQIEINSSAYYCIGINISHNHLRASIVDLAMNIVGKKTIRIMEITEVNEFKETVLNCIMELLADFKDIEKNKILGIGIGVPGSVDYDKGIILAFASKPNIINVDLKNYIEKKLGLQVFIDNNANTRALGEYWYGYGANFKNIIFAVCSEGIGSGIIADGNILRGKHNVTGEFGHMCISIGGRKCSCGKYGCVEAYCSLDAIENTTKDALKKGRKSLLVDLVKGDIDAIDYKLVCKCADSGDLLSKERLDEAACFLSAGLANTIQIINPEIVILSGELFDASNYFYELVKEYTKEKLSNSLTQDVIFVNRKVRDNLYETGAATLVYKWFFKD